jgi:ferredoxin
MEPEMPNNETKIHCVCRYQEALRIIGIKETFWVADCKCKVANNCKKSHIQTCIYFKEGMSKNKSNPKKLSKNEIIELLDYAKKTPLVIRHYRDFTQNKEYNDKDIIGFCLCCDCCCEFFHTRQGECETGFFIEQTDLNLCVRCGKCIDICYFNARLLDDNGLIIDKNRCSGCGACVYFCPVNCISMVERSV